MRRFCTMRPMATWHRRTPAWVRSRAWGMFCPGAPGALVGDLDPIRGGGGGLDPYSGVRFVYVEVLDLPGGSGLRTWWSGTTHGGPDLLVKSFSILPPWTRGNTGPTHKAGTTYGWETLFRLARGQPRTRGVVPARLRSTSDERRSHASPEANLGGRHSPGSNGRHNHASSTGQPSGGGHSHASPSGPMVLSDGLGPATSSCSVPLAQ
jgi:hypothetical protein